MTAGKTYKISFAQACRNDALRNTPACSVCIGTPPVRSDILQSDNDLASSQLFTNSFLDGQVKLMFVDEGPSNQYGVLLDSVVVEEGNGVPVPEFPTMALPVALIIGLSVQSSSYRNPKRTNFFPLNIFYFLDIPSGIL